MESLTQMYLELRNPVYRYLYYLCGNSDQAEDLTQETFFQALISLARFRGDSSVKTWLFSIARNTYLKNLKKDRRLPTEKLSDNTRPELSFSDNTNDPLRYVLDQEEKSNLIRLIGRLPENYKTVLVLREYEGWEYGELAPFLNQTENWARVTYYRAKQQLKELYQINEGGDS